MTAPVSSPPVPFWQRPEVRRWAPIVALAVVVVLVLTHPWSSSTKPAQTVQVVSPTTTPAPTTTTPGVDPLSNFGRLNPTADALVGQSFAARQELAHRISTVMATPGQPPDPCHVFLGATSDGSWAVSSQWGPAYPVPLLLGCPWTVTSPTQKAAP